jgi:uncharacterized protein YutE (UPF0331/DUF86 family)
MDHPDRLSHLPGVALLGQDARISIDEFGRPRVKEDPVLIILKGHLIIEEILIDICSRLLTNPAALEKGKVNFSTRLNLVRALIDNDELPENIWHALYDLNKIRNDLAHNLEPENIEDRFCQFIKRFEEFEEVRWFLDSEKDISERLTTCIIVLTGILSGIGKPADEHGGDDER